MNTTANLSAPSKSAETIQGMFNRIAKTYDLLNDCMTMGMHRRWKRLACNALWLQPGDTVLDLCTGTGDLAAILSGIVGPTGRVIAVDFSQSMLEVGQERFAHLTNIQWVQGDALAIPLGDGGVHGAIISFGLRNVASVDQCLSEMVRVVRPGGRVINLDTASDCKNPLFWLYFSQVMPLLGRFLAQDSQAYKYLCRSTQTFETPAEIIGKLNSLGLQHSRIERLGMGSVAMQCGQKPYTPNLQSDLT